MNGAVMLSGAKHLWLFLRIAKKSQRFFAALRMTFINGLWLLTNFVRLSRIDRLRARF